MGCDVCRGTGRVPGERNEHHDYPCGACVWCLRCKGFGRLKAPRPVSNPPCPGCGGTGRVPLGDANPAPGGGPGV